MCSAPRFVDPDAPQAPAPGEGPRFKSRNDQMEWLLEQSRQRDADKRAGNMAAPPDRTTPVFSTMQAWIAETKRRKLTYSDTQGRML